MGRRLFRAVRAGGRRQVPTLKDYRRALGEEIGGFAVYTTTALGTTTTLICTTAFLSTELPSDHLAYAWVYVPSQTLFLQRRVKDDGLTPGSGTITVDGVFGSAIGAGVEFEVSTRLPCIDGSARAPGVLSLNQCVVQGMRRLLVPGSRVDVTTVANQQEYTLTAQAGWLDDESRIVAIYDPPRASGFPSPPTRLRWTLKTDDGTPTLQFVDRAYPVSGFTFQVAVQRPGHTLVSGAESTTGPTSDSHTSPLSLNDVVTAAKVFAYQSLARTRPGAKGAEYQGLYEQALAEARQLPTWDRTRDRMLPAPPASKEAA